MQAAAGGGPVSTWAYDYCTVLRVVDGDTIWVEIDHGLSMFSRWPVRVLGCNAAERGTEGGDAATAHLTALLPAGTRVGVLSVQWDKYGGRILGYVRLVDGQDLGALLIATQWAAPWDGRGKAPVPPWPRTVSP